MISIQAQDDGIELLQKTKQTGKRCLGWFERSARKTSYENSTLNSFTELLSQRRNCSDLTSNQIVITFIAGNQTP